jgi:hypothetical protein
MKVLGLDGTGASALAKRDASVDQWLHAAAKLRRI